MSPKNQIEDYFPHLDLACIKLWVSNSQLFSLAPGSSHNHQDWAGGYKDHLCQTFEIASDLFNIYQAKSILPFSFNSALKVLFLHDLEKPFKYVDNPRQAEAIKDSDKFKADLIKENLIFVSEQEANALRYIHGEGDDYQKGERVMNELAAFCHVCDLLSARVFHSQRTITTK